MANLLQFANTNQIFADSGIPRESHSSRVGLTKSAALEVAKHNISINAIAACGIDAPGDVFHQWMEKEKITPEAAGNLFPIGRMGKADELTAAVLFLCSDQARFIVGHLLVVDGGWIAR